MNLAQKFAAIAGVSILLVGVSPFTANAAKKDQKISGSVTAVTANSITIDDSKTAAVTVVTVTDATKYTKTEKSNLSALQVGDNIKVSSKTDLAEGATTVDASHIQILSPLAQAKKHEGKKSVTGTVVTTTPSLTISTEDGTTVTVNTDAATKVTQSVPAALSDVVVGKRVTATGSTLGNTFTAKDIAVEAGKGKKS